jgi:hypothetical protein
MITEKQYWKGRDIQYADQLTDMIRANAAETMRRANALLALFMQANPRAADRDSNSGWRPREVNLKTKNASPTSKHMTGEAVDISDDDEALDRWLMTPEGHKALESCGLWMEHPSATPRWCHLQTRPPGSGKRVFYP